MARTAEEIEYTDAEAARIGYVDPPKDLEPTGAQGEDPKWTALVDWFDAHVRGGWGTAILVYISRRYDVSISEAYANTDSWAKAQIRRLDIRDDPEGAAHSYGN